MHINPTNITKYARYFVADAYVALVYIEQTLTGTAFNFWGLLFSGSLIGIVI